MNNFFNRNINDQGLIVTTNEILQCMVKGYEIQGILVLENSFNDHGLDRILLLKLATTSFVSKLFDHTHEQTVQYVSHTLVDGHSLRTYCHAPNTGSHKSWAAGNIVSGAVKIAFMMVKQTEGSLGDIPSILSALK